MRRSTTDGFAVRESCAIAQFTLIDHEQRGVPMALATAEGT
jgi:hypothetical protein